MLGSMKPEQEVVVIFCDLSCLQVLKLAERARCQGLHARLQAAERMSARCVERSRQRHRARTPRPLPSIICHPGFCDATSCTLRTFLQQAASRSRRQGSRAPRATCDGHIRSTLTPHIREVLHSHVRRRGPRGQRNIGTDGLISPRRITGPGPSPGGCLLGQVLSFAGDPLVGRLTYFVSEFKECCEPSERRVCLWTHCALRVACRVLMQHNSWRRLDSIPELGAPPRALAPRAPRARRPPSR